MQRTPLYDTHVALGGRMVEFAGYELPVQYPTGPIAEHNAVRNAAGLFDIDHMGQFELSGPDADLFLQLVQVYDIEQMALNDAHYSLLLYEDATVVDDIFLYKLPNRWLIAVNASNRAKDLAWLQAQALDFDLSLVDRSDDLCMLALQGPKAEQILQRLADKDLSTVAARTAIELTIDGYPVIAGRTGYTGEDGFEIILPVAEAEPTWVALNARGVRSCGLGARDTLRLEAGMNLYGNDMSESTHPLESGLAWTVAFEPAGRDFIGRAALETIRRRGDSAKLVGLLLEDRGVLRGHQKVIVPDVGEGEITSGTFSPTLEKSIALARVPKATGDRVQVDIRGKLLAARVVKPPFVRHGKVLVS